MDYRETLINKMIMKGITNCKAEGLLTDHMDLIYSMARSLDYKYGDKLTMGPEGAKETALDNFREMSRYFNSIEGNEELFAEYCFFEGVLSYVYEELTAIYKYEGITEDMLDAIAFEGDC